MSDFFDMLGAKASIDIKTYERDIKAKDEEIERLNNIIDKALHKLRASKDHFKTENENNAVTFTIKILEEGDKE